MIEMPELDRTITISAARSEYPMLGVAYSRPEYFMAYSPGLVQTGRNYYDSLRVLPKGIRMSTAAEELAIQLALERAGKDPREAEVFADLFGKEIIEMKVLAGLFGKDDMTSTTVRFPSISEQYAQEKHAERQKKENEMWYAEQITATGIRLEGTPEGGGITLLEYEEIGKRYPGKVLMGDKEIGKIIIPVYDGKPCYVIEWDEVFGLPKTIKEGQDAWNQDLPFITRFGFISPFEINYFGSERLRDEITKEYDFAVHRRGIQCRSWEKGIWHMDVGFCCRYDHDSGKKGFRPVRGEIPEITVKEM